MAKTNTSKIMNDNPLSLPERKKSEVTASTKVSSLSVNSYFDRKTTTSDQQQKRPLRLRRIDSFPWRFPEQFANGDLDGTTIKSGCSHETLGTKPLSDYFGDDPFDQCLVVITSSRQINENGKEETPDSEIQLNPIDGEGSSSLFQTELFPVNEETVAAAMEGNVNSSSDSTWISAFALSIEDDNEIFQGKNENDETKKSNGKSNATPPKFEKLNEEKDGKKSQASDTDDLIKELKAKNAENARKVEKAIASIIANRTAVRLRPTDPTDSISRLRAKNAEKARKVEEAMASVTAVFFLSTKGVVDDVEEKEEDDDDEMPGGSSSSCSSSSSSHKSQDEQNIENGVGTSSSDKNIDMNSVTPFATNFEKNTNLTNENTMDKRVQFKLLHEKHKIKRLIDNENSEITFDLFRSANFDTLSEEISSSLSSSFSQIPMPTTKTTTATTSTSTSTPSPEVMTTIFCCHSDKTDEVSLTDLLTDKRLIRTNTTSTTTSSLQEDYNEEEEEEVEEEPKMTQDGKNGDAGTTQSCKKKRHHIFPFKKKKLICQDGGLSQSDSLQYFHSSVDWWGGTFMFVQQHSQN